MDGREEKMRYANVSRNIDAGRGERDDGDKRRNKKRK